MDNILNSGGDLKAPRAPPSPYIMGTFLNRWRDTVRMVTRYRPLREECHQGLVLRVVGTTIYLPMRRMRMTYPGYILRRKETAAGVGVDNVLGGGLGDNSTQ